MTKGGTGYDARAMATPTIDQLTAPDYVENLSSATLEEIRNRRGACQDAEEALSLQRRLVQGRMDIVQAELYRRAGGTDGGDPASLVASLPDILVEHGDRHLGPGRLTSVGSDTAQLGIGFDELTLSLDRIVDGARLSALQEEPDESLRHMAEELDKLERTISHHRHGLHKHIDVFQEEIVRRYKSGEASVEGLLGS